VLIVLSGLPATGKSAIADGLGRAIGAPVLSVDPIEDAMLRSGIARDQPTGLAAYLVAAAVTESVLALGQSVVIDTVNAVVEAKQWWRDLADRSGVPLVVIETVCSDPQLHRRRLESRNRDLSAFAEPSWDAVVRRREEWVPWTVERLVIDAVESVDDNLARAIGWIRAAGHNKTPKGTSGP
jgi:predicted kinase